MSTIINSRTYVLDTNVLIGFSLWLPVSLNSVFWSKFEEALKNGDWILLDVITKEIKFKYDINLRKWCEKQKGLGLVKTISDNHRDRGVEINNQYKMIDETTKRSTVDTFLIAYAEASNLVVFS